MPKNFRDLIAFQRALDLAEVVYRVTESFPRGERFGLTSQIQKAAVRVPSDIAEGAGRFGYAEWRQLLSDARGSLYEVEAQALLSHRLRYIDDEAAALLNREIRKTGAALTGLLRWVRQKELEQKHRY
jgi:four helix bundle protein